MNNYDDPPVYESQYRNKPVAKTRHWLPFDEWEDYQDLNRETKMWHKHPAKPDGYPCTTPADCPVCREYHQWYVQQKSNEKTSKCVPSYEKMAKEARKSNKEVTMSEEKSYEYQNLYEVYTMYGEDRNSVIVKMTRVVAENENRAVMQAKNEIDPKWDMDYVEQSAQEICGARIQLKPRTILAPSK